jgi:hypothetical protein
LETAAIKIEGIQQGDLVVLMRDGNQRWVLADTVPVTCPSLTVTRQFVWSKGLGVFLPGLRDEIRREALPTR